MARLGLRWRIWLVLAAVTGFVLLCAGGILSVQTLDRGGEQLANLVYATTTSIDEQQFASGATRTLSTYLAPTGVLVRHDAPAPEAPRAPVGIVVLAKLPRLRGDVAAVRFEAGPPTRLWVQSRYQPRFWIGAPIQPLGAPIARASLWILLLTGAVVLIAGAVLARFLSRPLEQLARRAPNLMAGDLDLREFRKAPAEVQALAETLSRALEQTRARHHQREQTLVGLSHDLRTPLARLRFAIEMGDHNDPVARASMQADIGEMDALIGAFLLLQREGREEIESEFDAALLVRDLAAGFRSRGAIEVQGATQPQPIRGRRLAVHRALSNLVQNAFEHGSAPIALILSVEPGRVSVTVVGGGVREDQGRADGRGFGIGLGVVRAVAAMHAGGLEIAFGGSGSRVTLWLPHPRD